MICPKCGIELRAKERGDDGSVVLVCRNPKCEMHGRVIRVVK